MDEKRDLATTQTNYLERLGIYRRGYSPPGCYGKGRIVYRDQDLADRLALAGFQGYQLVRMFSGDIAMTLRTAQRLAKASLATYDNRNPDLFIRLEVLYHDGETERAA